MTSYVGNLASTGGWRRYMCQGNISKFVLEFLGPRGPLRTPSFVRSPVCPRQKSKSPLKPYKSPQDHARPRKQADVFYQTVMTNTKTKKNTKTKTEKFQGKWEHIQV